MKYLKALFFLKLYFFCSLALASDDSFISSDFRVSGNQLRYLGSVATTSAATPELQTFQSQNKESDDIGFFHGALKKSKGKPIRTFEFLRRDNSGMKSSSAEFNTSGEIQSFTNCDSWVGCVTITKGLCNEVTGMFKTSSSGPMGQFSNLTESELKRCGAIFEYFMKLGTFKNQEYQKLAETNYDTMFDYYKENIKKDAEPQWLSWVDRAFRSDPGQYSPHALKMNQSKKLEKTWSNRYVLGGLMKIYTTCDTKGHLLGADPIPPSAKKPKATEAVQ